MKVFLAGIMQGSLAGKAVHDQEYRRALKDLLAEHLSGVTIYDPWADHSGSLEYHAGLAHEVFHHHNRLAGSSDVVVAFVPEASMGTAIEMWEAYRNGNTVLTISPLVHNWAVRFLSHAVYPDLDAFTQALKAGEIATLLAARRAPARSARSG